MTGNTNPVKILFAASEAYPLIKTGGLGDVIYSLPRTLHKMGLDVRVILPAYRDIMEFNPELKIAGWLEVQGAGRSHPVRILESHDERLGVPVLLVDVADLFDRPGNPYTHPDGYDWPDNAERFTVFSRAAAQLASGTPDIGWRPDIVHAHDWQTGLIPAFLYHQKTAAPSIFTIHNLSYAGIFSHSEYTALGLPDDWWSSEGLEFHGNFSMLKAGLLYADHVNTVSPTYAKEILLAEFGNGFEGVLKSIRHKLGGLLNGIDQDIWNPKTDPELISNYSEKWQTFKGKRENKATLLKEMGIKPTTKKLQAPLLGLVSRLVEQKGIDLILDIIPKLLKTTDANLVILGAGQDYFERVLTMLAMQNPQRIAFHSGYSEELAHRIEAGADLFLMPSRFEPCGLNQLYSLRYGTPPVVHKTGGLADTVIDADKENIDNKTATGFVFDEPTPEALLTCLRRAFEVYNDKQSWRQIIRAGMQQDFSWTHSASEYAALYNKLLKTSSSHLLPK